MLLDTSLKLVKRSRALGWHAVLVVSAAAKQKREVVAATSSGEK